MAQLTFDLQNSADVSNALQVIRAFYPDMLGMPKMEVQRPDPMAAMPVDPADIQSPPVDDYIAPDDIVPEPVEIVEEPKSAPVNSAPEPTPTPLGAVDRDAVQKMVLDFLGKFGTKDEQLKHRGNILQCLADDMGCGSLKDVKDEQLPEAAMVIDSYIKTVKI